MVVRARGDVWPGASEVLDHVTPLQVWIENRGHEPIQIRYSEMSLQNSDGQTFRALAPWDIHGTVEVDVSVVPKSGPDSESTATTYGGYTYTNVEVKPPLAIRSLPYYDHLYDHWTADVPLPTPDMNQRALPEALLEPRAEASGFVYFEPIPKGQRELVTLNVAVVNAGSDAVVAKAEIPFQR
ncbi:MAG TPA: hypothetical protein VG963_01895, partial [Polyangiaceae bacterium]|nr:hypothetical protein [Polyangiaceae bacterium]